MTYNLLVSADADAWDRGSYVLSYGRFLEATDEEFVERFRSLDAASISSLVKFPALFAYETFVGKLARVGRITSIARRGLDVRITFEFNEQVPPLSSEQLDTLSWDLELGSLSRSNWSLKRADLLSVLQNAGITGAEQSSAGPPVVRFSRQTLIQASRLLEHLGHSGLDLFLLELGTDGFDASRQLGGLLARTNALAKFVVDNQDMMTADGEQLGLAVVRKASSQITDRDGSPTRENDHSDRFREALVKDGFAPFGSDVRAATDLPQTTVPAATPWQKVSPMTVSADTTPTPATKPEPKPAALGRKSTKVFLVHGRDDGAKETVARFLEQIGLEVVILHEQPNKGRTLMAKFMEEAKDGTAYAVVLMTPDDVGHAIAPSPTEDERRARQNVVFEFGFFVAHLGPERVCALLGEGVTKPSDIDGLAYVSYAASSRQWRMDLAKELRSANVQFNDAKVF